MFGIIYVTVNLLNGKKYIGQHKCSKDDDSYLGSGKALLNAISKHGKESFKRYTLYRAETEQELDEKEIMFIKLLNATDRDDYYNINEGGNANRMCGKNNPMYGRTGILAPNFGRIYTEEEKEKMRERILGEKNPMYGRKFTKEERKKFGSKGEAHWNYGRHLSEETKQKMSNTKKGKPSKFKNTKRSKEFGEKVSAAKKGKTPNWSEERRKSVSEFRTKQNQTDNFKKQISEANKRCHEQGIRRGNKPVVCVETNTVYASAYDAARAIGCGLSSISACLSGACKTVKKYHWRRATEEEASGELVYVA